ncbi:hypothetical protein HV096_14675 [Citrobacter freundii]|nr:hypothetical protein [Citrobacter freundii]HEE0108174.1 hypothetical protein [Citrobacter gillenii]MBA8033308.1 hypothetical protein [Citrobacter freundii]QLO03780.1 hypothetical protein HV141_09675 [Citrobacter freundii]QLU66388.1 hypothetical protein HV173_09325 [Citrobacter freundii]HEE0121539.1 hypothetical protein [Citrobacter gillenii]
MKRSRVRSYFAFTVLLMTSFFAIASTLQDQAARERELSAALSTDNSVIIIGGTEDFGFTLRSHNKIHRSFAIQDGIGDPIMFNRLQNQSYNPARDGFSNNPAHGGFMMGAPIRR